MASRKGFDVSFTHHRVAVRTAAVLFVAAFLGLAPCGDALAASGTWTATTSGSWNTTSNWSGGTIGTGTAFTATFGPDIGSDVTVTNDQQRAIGTLVFGTAASPLGAGNWTVTGSAVVMNMGTNTLPATITVNSLGSVSFSGTVQANTTQNSLLVKNGAGKLILTNTGNSISNKISITAGTLEVGAERVLGTTPGSFAADQLQISSGGTFRTTATATISANRGITIGSGGGTISVNGGGLTIATRLTGAGNTATVAGANGTTLTNTTGTATDVNWDFAANNGVRAFFEGANALGTGAVTVRNGVRLTSQSTAPGTLANALTLDSGAGLTARSSGGAVTYTNVIFPSSGSVVFNKDDQTTSSLTITSSGSLAGNLTIDTSQGGTNAVADVFLDGAFSGVGGLVKSGTGTSGRLVLRGANTYTGTTNITTGTLQLGNGGTVGRLSTSSVLTGSAGGTLVFNRSDTISSGTHFNSVIGGGISVSQVGSGTVVLSSSSTYTGTTSITNGAIEISNASSLGPAPGSFTADHLQMSGSATLRTTTAVSLGANRGITVGAGTATLNINGGNLQAGRFTGAGNTVLATGSASLSLLAVTTGTANVNWDFAMNSGQRAFFAGSPALGTGSVRVRNGNRLVSQNTAPTGGQVTNAVTIEDGGGLAARTTAGTVEYTNVTLPSAGSIVLNKDDLATTGLTILSGVALTGGLTIDTSQQAANAVGDVTLAGVFSGAGGLTKLGTGSSGIVILGNANTYTGNTTISTGTLKLGAAGSIANSGTISVASGGVFDTNTGFSLAATQWLMGSGTVLGNVSALGTIAPGVSGSVGTLSFVNDLAIDSGSLLSYGLNGTNTTAGGVVNDLAVVAGSLTLDGTLNVSEIGVGSFLSATQGNTWRLFTYTGALTNNGLSLGTVPALSSGLSFAVDTSTPNEVNLIVVPEPIATGAALLVLGAGAVVRARRRRSDDASRS
ncbi:MAG: beta strand repeat-containing protein [Planctomycetaceae bacterium]